MPKHSLKEVRERNRKGFWKKFPRFLNFRWGALSSILNNRIVQSSSVWLVLTPILAKSLMKIEQINLPWIAGYISFSLPFSWTCFFFGALFFSISSTLYNIFCPSVIRRYQSLNDYKSKDHSISHLKDLFLKGLPKSHPNVKDEDECMNYFYSYWVDQTIGNEVRGYFYKRSEEKGFEDHFIRDDPDSAFSALRIIFNATRPFIRFLITMFFYIGAFFLILVVLQNVLFVFENINWASFYPSHQPQ